MINTFNLFKITLKKSWGNYIIKKDYLDDNKCLIVNELFETVLKKFIPLSKK
jgi:hypothetical protein